MYNVYNEKHILAYLVYSYLLSNWGASIPRPTRIPDRDTSRSQTVWQRRAEDPRETDVGMVRRWDVVEVVKETPV